MFTKSDFKRVWTKLSIFRYYDEINKSIFPRKSLYDIWGNKNLVRRVDDRFDCVFIVKNDSRSITDAIELLNRVSNKTFFVKTISNGILK